MADEKTTKKPRAKPIMQSDIPSVALGEALRVPQVLAGKYNSSPLPSEKVAANVIAELGIPVERAMEGFQPIKSGAQTLGLLTDLKGKSYVRLDVVSVAPNDVAGEGGGETDLLEDEDPGVAASRLDGPAALVPRVDRLVSGNRVFVTHGSNKDIVGQIKEILTFGKFEPVVSVEKESVAKPVPDKVLDDIAKLLCGDRACRFRVETS